MKKNQIFCVSTRSRCLVIGVLLASLCLSTGCQALLATVLMLTGGTNTKAKYKFFKGKKVAVACVSETLNDPRYDDVPRDLAKTVGLHLSENVKKIEIITPSKINKWLERHDGRIDDPQELGQDMEADMVMVIELASFETSTPSSPGNYQGRASASFIVYEVKSGKQLGAETISEFVYPPNLRVSATDTRESDFRIRYLKQLSREIACHFYSYDHRDNMAMDAHAGLGR
jgi:hypothetical protein